MVILITLFEMKNIIELLYQSLKACAITRHVICPSAKSILQKDSINIACSIEIIDERSAGYVATGMCDEISAPVVLWCASDDSIRNLSPSLTEAYYRKLPLLVVAFSVQSSVNHGTYPHDIIRYDVSQAMDAPQTLEDRISKALACLSADVKGPVFLPINLYESTDTATVDINESKDQLDITEIIERLPSEACIHVGKNFRYDNVCISEIVSRADHCNSDGNVSMLIGSSLVAKEQIHIGILGFDEVAYDLNMLGNRHIGDNVFIVCVNPSKEKSHIHDFFRSMLWECKSVRMDEIEKVLFIKSGKPQFIEVAL